MNILGSQYRTILREATDEIIIEKSRFIAYAKPVESEEEAIAFIASIKKKHKDATHNVPAYLIGEQNEIQRYNDDGEPSGTAGVPILEMMKKEDLKNLVVVVTRYFGGIKLGTGGLVRAYTKAAKMAIDASQIIFKSKLTQLIFRVDYNLLGKIEYEIEKNNFIIYSKSYMDCVEIVLLVEDESITEIVGQYENWIQNKADYSVGKTELFNVINGKVIYNEEA